MFFSSVTIQMAQNTNELGFILVSCVQNLTHFMTCDYNDARPRHEHEPCCFSCRFICLPHCHRQGLSETVLAKMQLKMFTADIKQILYRVHKKKKNHLCPCKNGWHFQIISGFEEFSFKDHRWSFPAWQHLPTNTAGTTSALSQTHNMDSSPRVLQVYLQRKKNKQTNQKKLKIKKDSPTWCQEELQKKKNIVWC